MKKITLKSVNDAVCIAHGYCNYYPSINQTYGPHNVRDLSGPSTSRYYDCCRVWDTQIAVAMAEDQFDVDLSLYDIVNHGPWRDTVRSIHAAINSEIDAQALFESEIQI